MYGNLPYMSSGFWALESLSRKISVGGLASADVPGRVGSRLLGSFKDVLLQKFSMPGSRKLRNIGKASLDKTTLILTARIELSSP